MFCSLSAFLESKSNEALRNLSEKPCHSSSNWYQMKLGHAMSKRRPRNTAQKPTLSKQLSFLREARENDEPWTAAEMNKFLQSFCKMGFAKIENDITWGVRIPGKHEVTGKFPISRHIKVYFNHSTSLLAHPAREDIPFCSEEETLIYKMGVSLSKECHFVQYM